MHMVRRHQLGLDEALLTINKSAYSGPSLELFYQIDECFGCPFDKLEPLHKSDTTDDFLISTKYGLQLEIRSAVSEQLSAAARCRFKDLTLNSQGTYKIDVITSSQHSNSTLDCSIQTLNEGACQWCPLAGLLCFLILASVGERIWSKLSPSGGPSGKVARHRQQPEPTSADGEANDAITNGGLSPPVDERQSVGEPQGEQGAPPGGQTPKMRRVESLDTFRGFTIAGMIMVNYGGAGYTQLEHAAWDGITLADFVFPFFIFSMGASIALSQRRTFASSGQRLDKMMLKILKRSLILLALGLCLNSKWLNGASLAHLRLTGVLQRFSLSYLAVASLYSLKLALERWASGQSVRRARLISTALSLAIELLAGFLCLAAYLYVTFYLDYSPPCPTGYTGPGGQTEGGRYANCTGGAAAWLDRLVLGEQHLYLNRNLKQIFKAQTTQDPEGLLGCSTSILLTLIGLQCGKILARFKAHKLRLLMFLQWLVLLALSCSAVLLIPINKHLWSLTFVTLTGKNSILLYVGHSVLSEMLPWHFSVDESSRAQLLARLAWATFVWLLLAHYLATRRIFVRI